MNASEKRHQGLMRHQGLIMPVRDKPDDDEEIDVTPL